MRAVRRAFIVLLCVTGFVANAGAPRKNSASPAAVFRRRSMRSCGSLMRRSSFKKYGLDGEYLALESGTPAMQALLANELQIVFTTGALAITANLQGADTTIIAGGINFIPNKLLVRPDIKTPEGLKGKRIAISRFGSASDYATQVALEKLGINPKDVTIVQTGGNMTRLAALSQGTVHATLLSEPHTTVGMREFKLNSLIDLAESGVAFPQNCFIVKRSYFEANRPKIVNAMKAIIESYFVLRKDKALACP